MQFFEYKSQRCFYKGTIVYICQIVFCVCCMYSTWHTVMDTFTYYTVKSVPLDQSKNFASTCYI